MQSKKNRSREKKEIAHMHKACAKVCPHVHKGKGGNIKNIFQKKLFQKTLAAISGEVRIMKRGLGKESYR